MFQDLMHLAYDRAVPEFTRSLGLIDLAILRLSQEVPPANLRIKLANQQ